MTLVPGVQCPVVVISVIFLSDQDVSSTCHFVSLELELCVFHTDCWITSSLRIGERSSSLNTCHPPSALRPQVFHLSTTIFGTCVPTSFLHTVQTFQSKVMQGQVSRLGQVMQGHRQGGHWAMPPWAAKRPLQLFGALQL